jgi:hypothetical protein
VNSHRSSGTGASAAATLPDGELAPLSVCACPNPGTIAITVRLIDTVHACALVMLAS